MKSLKVNCKTGKEELIDDGKPFISQPNIIVKGIDYNKLKAILKSKGIIDNFSEVE